LPNAFGPAVEAGPPAVLDAEPELGRDHYLVAKGPHCLSDHFLVGERAVYLGRVEEDDAALEGRADQRDAFLLAQVAAVAEVETHAAEAKS
jgi:hypothetical protein